MTAKFKRNEHGIITRVVDNPTKKFHKETEETYTIVKDAQKKIILDTEKLLESHLNKVKAKILNVCVVNISNTIDYYFSTETGRIDVHQDELFIQSLKQIYNITRIGEKQSDLAIDSDLVMINLKKIKASITAQRKLVLEIQAKMATEKNEKNEKTTSKSNSPARKR